jgi:hypothetical protein
VLAATLALVQTVAPAQQPADAPSRPDLNASLDNLEAFRQALGLHEIGNATVSMSPSQWQRLEPSLYYFILEHRAHFRSLTIPQQTEFVGRLAEFIVRKRKETDNTVVIGPGRSIVALLGPERGLQRQIITTMAAAYGAPASVFKLDETQQTLAQFTAEYLAVVERLAAGVQPATLVILGHGLPEEIQEYKIQCRELAAALCAGARTRSPDDPLDLSHLVIVIDSCFSANFAINLGAAIEEQGQRHRSGVFSLPTMIASVNRDREAFAKGGELFVPRFWEAVVQLYYVNQPRPRQLTLGDFFDRIDNYMYGYGRLPRVEGRHVAAYRVVNPSDIQDPVVFVPLTLQDKAELRSRLNLGPPEPLPSLLDIGSVPRMMPHVN